MMKIKAIETSYNGYKFRSRLEARWAVFFDLLDIKYEYEKEGFNLPHGPYLPDFFLPDIRNGFWIEVKPNISNHYDELPSILIRELCKATGFEGMVVRGEPALMTVDSWSCEIPGVSDGSAYWLNGGDDGPYLFCICPKCGKIGIEYGGRGSRVCRHNDDDKGYSNNHPRLELAACHARAERFERRTPR